MVREGNSACDRGDLHEKEQQEIASFMNGFSDVFGVLDGGAVDELLEPELQALIEARDRARRAKDFRRADEIRAELEGRGILVEDTPKGVRWKRKK
jgi:cysteinyl-tRNA synthetase